MEACEWLYVGTFMFNQLISLCEGIITFGAFECLVNVYMIPTSYLILVQLLKVKDSILDYIQLMSIMLDIFKS